MTGIEAVPPLVQAMLRLPFFESLPGSVLEEILAHVYSGERTGTYDFADVVSGQTAWQVKSTRVSTPVTWKRAKLPNKAWLIEGSRKGAAGAQALGDAIIAFCNDAAKRSVQEYGLKRLVYARLIDYMDSEGRLTYFERDLPVEQPLFNPADFRWLWSEAKRATKKEQLQAFHGIHRATGRSWFAWHGLGENQLHFKGESAWWPADGHQTRVDFKRAGGALDLVSIAELIAAVEPAIPEPC